MKKIIFPLILLFANAAYSIPQNVRCLQSVSKVTCQGEDSDLFYGSRAWAKCRQTAVFRTIYGAYVTEVYEGEGSAYNEGFFSSDVSIAKSNARADVEGYSAGAQEIPSCK